MKRVFVEAESKEKEPKEGLKYFTFLYSIPPCIHVEWGNSLGEPLRYGLDKSSFWSISVWS